MLAQNTAVFIKLPNAKFGLRDWYPNARKPQDGEEEPKGGRPRLRVRIDEDDEAKPEEPET